MRLPSPHAENPSRGVKRALAIPLVLLIVIVLALSVAPQKSYSAAIEVNSYDDEFNTDGDCSLREAVASAADDAGYDACTPGSGVDVITLPAGTYPVSSRIYLIGEMVLSGSGVNTTFIDGGGSSAIFGRVLSATPVTIRDLTLRNGYTGVGNGGGCFSQGQNYVTSFQSVRFENCTAEGRGGAIWNSGTLIIEDSLLSGNSAASESTGNLSGGAVYNSTGGSLTVINTQFIDNRADPDATDGSGGAIHSASSLSDVTIIDSSFFYNQGRSGGAILSLGTLNIENSTFGQNTADQGGAIYIGASGNTHSLTNSTLAGNASGALFNAGETHISNTTFASNTSLSTIISTGTLTIKNSILNRIDGDNCSQPLTSEGYNIENTNSCGFSAVGDLPNTNPLLGTFNYHGGPTMTIRVVAGSPAIDAGDPSGCTDGLGAALLVDQRGFPRPVDGDLDGTARCDIGAYERELQTLYLPFVTR